MQKAHPDVWCFQCHKGGHLALNYPRIRLGDMTSVPVLSPHKLWKRHYMWNQIRIGWINWWGTWQRWLDLRDQTYATCLYEISEQVQFSLNKVYLLPKWTYWHQTNPVLCKTDWSWSLLVGNEGSSHGIPEVPVHWSITDTLGKNGELEPSDMCSWVGIDIVHYNDKYYLTLIDCGFTRFTNWEIAALEGFSQYNWPFEGHILQMLLFH